MKPKLAIVLLLALPVLLAACGGDGSDGPPSELDATFEAALEEAEKTPVSDDLRDYARQLCDPLVAFFEEGAAEFSDAATTESESRQSPGDLLADFDLLRGTLIHLFESLQEVEPPESLRAYHEAGLVEIEGLLSADDQIMLALFSQPLSETETFAIPGLDAAYAQECSKDLFETFKQIDPEFFEDEYDGDQRTEGEQANDPLVQAYAQRLCAPFEDFISTIEDKDQIRNAYIELKQEFDDITPPPAMEEYQQASIALIDYVLATSEDFAEAAEPSPADVAPDGFLDVTIFDACGSDVWRMITTFSYGI